MDTWTLPQAADALGFKEGKVRAWFDGEKIKPTKPVKRGETYQLVIQDLRKLKLFQSLIDRGFYREQVKEIVAGYKDDEDYLAVCKTGDRLSYHYYKKGASIKLKDEDNIFIVNLDKIRKSIKFEVKKVKIVVS